MIILDVVVMGHYIHKQPYSIIYNSKYIVGKSSTIYIYKKFLN